MDIKGKMRSAGIGPAHIAVLLIVWLAFLLSFVDRLSWPAVMPLASESLGLTSTQAGSYMSAFYIGYVATQLPGGLLADRFGYRRVLIVSFLMMGGFTALMGVADSYETGFVFRVLAGVGSGAVGSSCIGAIFDWFPPQNRGKAMGVYMTASSLGLGLVNLIVPPIARAYNWNVSFMAVGLVTASCALLAAVWLQQKTPAGRGIDSRVFWRDTLALFRNKELLSIGAAGFFAMWGTWGVATWTNNYMNKALDVPLVEAGRIAALYGFAALLCKPACGVLTDIFRQHKKLLLAVILSLFGPALILFGHNTSVAMLYLLMPLVGITAFMYSPLMNLMVGESVRSGQVSTAFGFTNTIWQLGSLASPLAAGAVLDSTQNYVNVFYCLAAGPIISALIVFALAFLERRRKPA